MTDDDPTGGIPGPLSNTSVVLNNGKEVTTGSLVNIVFAICEFYETPGKDVFEELAKVVATTAPGAALTLSNATETALAARNILNAHPDGVRFHIEAEAVIRAMLRDILAGRGSEPINPLPLGHAKRQEVDILIREARRLASQSGRKR